MGIVTKKGDKGKTRTMAGEEISKADVSLTLMGDLDELNGVMGFARSLLKEERLEAFAKELMDVQRVLARLMAEASCGPKGGYADGLTERDVDRIEKQIARYEQAVALPKSFIVAGATAAAAAIEIARAVARRAERSAVGLNEKGLFPNTHALIWLNRFSDYLFIVARAAEKESGVEFETAT